MKALTPSTERAEFTATNGDVFVVFADMERIVRQLRSRAERSKTGKATALRGAVSVHLTRKGKPCTT